MAPIQTNASQPPVVASSMASLTEDAIDTSTHSTPLVPSMPIPLVHSMPSPSEGSAVEPKPAGKGASGQLSGPSSLPVAAMPAQQSSTPDRSFQQPTGRVSEPTAAPNSEQGIHITLPWVHTDAESLRHQFSPTKVCRSPSLGDTELPKVPAPSAERLKELASPRVHGSFPCPRPSSPFYTGLGPGASPTTFSELAQASIGGTSSRSLGGGSGHTPKAQKAAALRTISHTNTGVHTAFGSRIKPSPPKPPTAAKGKSLPRPLSNTPPAGTPPRRASVDTSASSGLLAKGKLAASTAARRTSVDNAGSATLPAKGTRKPRLKSFMGSSAPTGRTAATRSFQGAQSAAPTVPGNAGAAVAPQDGTAQSPPISIVSSLHADDSGFGANYHDAQHNSLSPSQPLTAFVAAAAAAAYDGSLSGSGSAVPAVGSTQAAPDTCASAQNVELSTLADMQRWEPVSLNADARTEGLSPFGTPGSRPTSNAVAAPPHVSDAYSGLGKRQSVSSAGGHSTPHALNASTAGSRVHAERCSLSSPGSIPGNANTDAPDNVATAKATAEKRGSNSAAGATKFAEPSALEPSGLLDDSNQAPAPMSMVNSMMGSVIEEVVPVSQHAVEMGAPDSIQSSIPASHAYMPGQLGSGVGNPSRTQAPPTRGKQGPSSMASQGYMPGGGEDHLRNEHGGAAGGGVASERGGGSSGAVRNAGGKYAVGLVGGPATGGQVREQGVNSSSKKQSMGGRLCGMLLCGRSRGDAAEHAEEGLPKQGDQQRQETSMYSFVDQGKSMLSTIEGGTGTVSADNTNTFARPIQPGGMSPPRSLTPTPVPKLPVASPDPSVTRGTAGGQQRMGKNPHHAAPTAGGAATAAAAFGGAKAVKRTGPQSPHTPSIVRSNSHPKSQARRTPSSSGNTASKRTQRGAQGVASVVTGASAGAAGKAAKDSRVSMNDVKGSELKKEPRAQVPTASDGSNAVVAPSGGPGLCGTDSMISTAGGGHLETMFTTADKGQHSLLSTADRGKQSIYSTADGAGQHSMYNTADGVQQSSHGTAYGGRPSLFSTADQDQGHQSMFNTADGAQQVTYGNAVAAATAAGGRGPLMDSEAELASQLLPQIAGESHGVIEATMLGHATLPARVVF